MRSSSWRRLSAAAAAACLLALAGCGDGDDPSEAEGPDGPATTSAATSPTPSPTEPTSPTTKPVPDLPDCADLWVEGKVLPRGYRGCVDEYDQVSKSIRPCSIGSKLAQHGDQYYAIVGRQVMRALPSRNANDEYLDFLATCSG